MQFLRIAAAAAITAAFMTVSPAKAGVASGIIAGAPLTRSIAAPAQHPSTERAYYYSYRRVYHRRPYWRRYHYWYPRRYYSRRYYWRPYRYHYRRYWYPHGYY